MGKVMHSDIGKNWRNCLGKKVIPSEERKWGKSLGENLIPSEERK